MSYGGFIACEKAGLTGQYQFSSCKIADNIKSFQSFTNTLEECCSVVQNGQCHLYHQRQQNQLAIGTCSKHQKENTTTFPETELWFVKCFVAEVCTNYEASPDVSVNQQSGNVTNFSLTTVILNFESTSSSKGCSNHDVFTQNFQHTKTSLAGNLTGCSNQIRISNSTTESLLMCQQNVHVSGLAQI